MSKSVVLYALLVIAGCGREATAVAVPCPTPPSAAVPAVDTVTIGDTIRFRVPLADLNQQPARRIIWSSSRTVVASVSPDSGLARALSLGSATIEAVDQLSPANCPARWAGLLVVR